MSKNMVYAGVIGVCILAAIVVFVKTHGGNNSGVESLGDEMTWVMCLKCGKSYEMPLKEYYKEAEEKSRASAAKGLPMAPPLTCRECGQDGIIKAIKCPKCGDVFREGSVPNDYPDRCPKCRYSAMEAKREANKAAQGQK